MKMMFTQITLALSLMAILQPCLSQLSGPKLTTTWGQFSSIYNSDNTTLIIQAIRYAEKPERFEKAKAMGKASQFTDTVHRVCPQKPKGKIVSGDLNEDCLTMDIYRPANNAKSLVPPPTGSGINNNSMNIVVLFPLVSFARGGCKDVDLSRMANQQNVVAVCVQNRLGVFGFSAFPEDDDKYNGTTEVENTNLGLLDQQIALEFIRDNRAFLGGPDANITLIGAGAGAASVHYRLLTKNDNIVDRAILIDGFLNDYYSMPTFFAAKHSSSLANALKCKEKAKKCLKGMKFNLITSAQEEFPWGPTWKIEEAREYKNPFAYSDNIKEVPIIVGTSGKAGARDVIMRNEEWHKLSLANVADKLNDYDKFKAAIKRQWPRVPVWNQIPTNEKLLNVISAYYYPFNNPNNGSLALDGLINSVSDAANNMNVLAYVRAKNQSGNNQTYFFHYGLSTAAAFSEPTYEAWTRPSVGNYIPVLLGLTALSGPEQTLSNSFRAILTEFYSQGSAGAMAQFKVGEHKIYDMRSDGTTAVVSYGRRMKESKFWNTVSKELVIYPEPPKPEPEPSYGTLIGILVGIGIVVVFGIVIGVLVANHDEAQTRKSMLNV